MSALTVLGLGLLGGAGSVARFLLDGAVGTRIRSRFPFGTLAVNVVGSFALGVLVGAGLSTDAQRLAGTGFIGAFTTFSTWMLESRRLAEERRLAAAGVNIALSLGLGVGAATLGRLLARRL